MANKIARWWWSCLASAIYMRLPGEFCELSMSLIILIQSSRSSLSFFTELFAILLRSAACHHHQLGLSAHFINYYYLSHAISMTQIDRGNCQWPRNSSTWRNHHRGLLSIRNSRRKWNVAVYFLSGNDRPGGVSHYVHLWLVNSSHSRSCHQHILQFVTMWMHHHRDLVVDRSAGLIDNWHCLKESEIVRIGPRWMDNTGYDLFA